MLRENVGWSVPVAGEFPVAIGTSLSGTENLGMLETKLDSLELERLGLVRYSIPDRQSEDRFLGITGENAVSCMFLSDMGGSWREVVVGGMIFS